MDSYRDLLPDSDQPPDPDGATHEALLELLHAQAALLVTVATGGPRIQDVNACYIRRRRKLNSGLRRHGITPPFPFDDLFAWPGYWSGGTVGAAGKPRSRSSGGICAS